MAHVRTNCKNDSITFSAPPKISALIKKHRFRKEFDYQSEAITDLIIKGLKYEQLVEKKKRERVLV